MLRLVLRQGLALWGVVLLACLAGCTGWAVDARPPAAEVQASIGDSAVSREKLERVAADMVTAMVKLPALDPSSTVVQIPPQALTPLHEAMIGALGQAGYQLRRDGSSATDRALRAQRDDHTYTVGIGDIYFRRAYAASASDGDYAPAGSLFVKGADVTAFAEPLTALVGAPLVTQATQASGIDPLRPYSENVFDLGASNYGAILGDYEDVDERILIFGNDSLRLGDGNKQEIAQMARQFDARSDLFSIIGCSLGPTAIDNGNQVLATGRANRVKEALLFAGVPAARILDEGCWAGETLPSMPSRGVILTLKRTRSAE